MTNLRAPAHGIRIVRLGGSLLDYAGLAADLRAWLAAQPQSVNVIIVGGGAWAEAFREAHRVHELSEVAAHWLCVRAMSLTARLVAELLPEARLVDRIEELSHKADPARPIVFDAWPLLRGEIERGDPGAPPESWAVTSDSIAAHVARQVPAAELVLLKSALPPAPYSAAQLATAGYVDAYFPFASAGLPAVRFVNLRSAGFPEVWQESERPTGTGGR